jgi:hypothetical protein
MFRLFSPVANSPRRHLSQDVVRISTLAALQQPVSAPLPRPDVDHLLRAMVDPRGTLIHIGRDLSPGLDPRGATGPGQDPFLRDPVPHPAEEEDEEIVRVVMEVEGGEVQVIAATAAMTIGAEAGAVDAVVVADVNGGL